MLWFEFLSLSPSYELARRYRKGLLSKADRTLLPEDFDVVLSVYEDFGDVQRTHFLSWWKERGMELCGHQGKKPRVTEVASLIRKPTGYRPTIEKLEEFIETEWKEQGQQKTMLIAVPIGLSKSQISKQINQRLDKISTKAKKIKPPEPKYGLVGKRHDKEMLFRYMAALHGKAVAPDMELWRIGARMKISETYSPELEYDAKVKPKEATYDRMMLTILTSRALLRGRLIAENAARGIFPSYKKNEHALDIDFGALRKQHISRQRWKKRSSSAAE